MSAALLQRVVVRMLHDPAFRAAVYADPARALTGLPLSAADHALLIRADPRAWSVDPHRADRVLGALLHELPVTALALLLDGVPLPPIAGFFRTPSFHDAIMARRSLAPAFAEHLATLARTPRARALLSLERAIVRLRRAPAAYPPPPPGHLRLSPRALPVALAAGTLHLWDVARKALGPEPTAALVAARLPRLGDVDPREREWVLLEMNGDSPQAGFIGEALGRLLEAAERPVARAHLAGLVQSEGADASEAAEVIAELVADQLLVA